MKGQHPNTEWVNVELMYWYFARSFGWTPQQVDAQYESRLIYLKEAEDAAKKMEADAMKKR